MRSPAAARRSPAASTRKTLTLGSDLDYVRGNHTWRIGHADRRGATGARTITSNYLGTYTFESLDAFEAGRPRSYTRRIGDPNIDYNNFQGALYVQDDIRVRRNLTLSGGAALRSADARRRLRQHHAALRRHLGARHRAARRRCARAGASSTTGCRTSTYEQTLRVDGFRQQEIEHRQSAVSRSSPISSLRRRAGQPLPARRRSRAAALDARQPRHRSAATSRSRRAPPTPTSAAAPSRAATT